MSNERFLSMTHQAYRNTAPSPSVCEQQASWPLGDEGRAALRLIRTLASTSAQHKAYSTVHTQSSAPRIADLPAQRCKVNLVHCVPYTAPSQTVSET